MGRPMFMHNPWELEKLREQAGDYLYNYDDVTDKSNHRSLYLKQWMLKEYECSTLQRLRTWARYG